MIKFLLVFIGGGLGSMARYSIFRLLEYKQFDFPYATMLSNIIACLILGFLLGIELKSGVSSTTKVLLMTGFCGGFSTFSTFSADSLKLIYNGNFLHASAYILASFIICLFCILVGMKSANIWS